MTDANIKAMYHSLDLFSSSNTFRVGQTCPLFLFNSRTHRHEESTSNLWTFVLGESILHQSVNPPRPTVPSWFKLDVKFLLWLQRLDSCSDIPLLYSCPTISQLLSPPCNSQYKGSFIQAAIKALLKLINISPPSFYFLSFNTTRGTQQPQLLFLYKW